MSKPSKYGHSVAIENKGYNKQSSKQSRNTEDRFKPEDYPTEPKWDEFLQSYKDNLGRHSVNYHSWYYCKDEGFFKDMWDKQQGLFEGDWQEKYPKNSEFTLDVENVITGEKSVLNMSSHWGNPDSMFGGESPQGIMALLMGGYDHWLPFGRIGYLDGFSMLRISKLFPIRGSISVTFVDNDHWPALRRGSIILINEKYRNCAICQDGIE